MMTINPATINRTASIESVNGLNLSHTGRFSALHLSEIFSML